MSQEYELFKRWSSGQPWFILIKLWIYNSFVSFLGPELLLTLNSRHIFNTRVENQDVASPIVSRTLQEVRMMELTILKKNISNQKRKLNVIRDNLQQLRNEFSVQEKVQINKRKIVKISDYSLEDIFMEDDSFCSSATGYFSTISACDKITTNGNDLLGNKVSDNIGLNLKIIQK
ncbi:hypothetical protein, no similarity [Maudiozyma barnettii]|uniref:Uncharacterized protein n=1 Tax=Maudiozyma barnettii TaxID=61262 RepID=A0A8H2VBE3_9SACH|nr:hypothetical protein, no similarity [Kazachstania barnettii]CAB4252182.1 hypothetical protein, no similarity [Kazachstania barnettii]CAD1778783.1 hypothetical protein, no similarity [Kazachstania barnettii]